jgi:glutaconate CoA-transferase subunit B
MSATRGEIMVAQAAREIRDGETVFVGMRLPLIAFVVAKRTHAPHATGIFELGILRDAPARELLYTMGDPPNVSGARWSTRTVNVMGLLQRGEIAAGFIGGAEVDRFGNVNTSYIGDPARPNVKLPGSGGGADIACLAQRLIVIMAHEKKRFRERVDYITSPGYGDGDDWRARIGLPRGGTAVVITTLGVLRFDATTREAYLASYHPGSSVEECVRETGWPLRVAADVRQTERPTDAELAVIREYDPKGFWTSQ